MNIYILNATSLGKLALEILSNNIGIKGIITLKKEVGIKETKEYYDCYDFCVKNHIEYIGIEAYDFSVSKDRERLDKLKIDLLIVTSWQRLIPNWLIEFCSIGVIGTHGSAEGITNGRGRSPQNWALILGKKEFYISIFWINSGVDSGDIIDTSKFVLEETDDILTSYLKVNMLVVKMIIDNLQNGRIQRKEGEKQTEEGYYLPKRTREDGKIDWNRESSEIYNMIRGLTCPYPGAYTSCKEQEFFIFHAIPISFQFGFTQSKNGEIVSIINNNIIVKCGKGLLVIKDCSNKEMMYEGMVFDSSDFREQMENIICRHMKKYDFPISKMIIDAKIK